jgi:hypothetical protein
MEKNASVSIHVCFPVLPKFLLSSADLPITISATRTAVLLLFFGRAINALLTTLPDRRTHQAYCSDLICTAIST